MPWLRVNHTRLCWLRAVPTPLFALEVQRGGIPGQPGANRSTWLSLTKVPCNAFRDSIKGPMWTEHSLRPRSGGLVCAAFEFDLDLEHPAGQRGIESKS